jgi:hypothetical protein
MTIQIIHADCLEWMRSQPDNSVDLVFGSPPYEAARTYGIDFKLQGQDWVDWMVVRMTEMVRISKGLVAMVVEGQTRKFRWSATPALLMADLHRAGIHLRKPPIFHRVGIPGSGGPDWLRNDYEFIVCCTGGGKLPWSENTAMGGPCKYGPGGDMSHRTVNGERVNNGKHRVEPKVANAIGTTLPPGAKLHTKNNGKEMRQQLYIPPEKANPGNVIHCVVGGGRMGSQLAHGNEAPFPEALAEFFVRSFCPPQGVVYDPFCGSGTTAAVALMTGRNAITTDIRESQVDLANRRLATVQPRLI